MIILKQLYAFVKFKKQQGAASTNNEAYFPITFLIPHISIIIVVTFYM